MTRFVLLFSLLPALVACGASAVDVPVLSPTVTPRQAKASGSYELNLGGIKDEAVCSKASNLEDLCIVGVRTAIEDAFDKVLGAHFDGDGDQYAAKFRFLKFGHRKKGQNIEVSFDWTFSLTKPDGTEVLLMSEQTIGPETIAPEGDAERAIGAALDAVFDSIADTMVSADL